ncbi:MAG: nitrite reductase (NAD(P)H) small subunit [Chitinophagaceae bacterium]|nr:nitrite reductase (NAD(P)H) small subunit [Chitinophagaceae bacterium]
MVLKWHKIAEDISELNISPTGLTEIEIAGKKICIAVYNNTLHACAAKCPHASGVMAQGHIDAVGNIICPLHRYKFALQNGRNVSGEGYFLKTHPIEVKKEGVFIGIIQNSLF